MRRMITILVALCMLGSLSLLAQDTTSQSNTMKADNAMKPSHITGKISDDGKSFVSDKDNKTYTIDNPDAVKGHEGHHVTLKAKVNGDTGAVSVMSLKMAPQSQMAPQNP